jgi:GDP-4-dehydro-6-deoxy-D-mannose reductase
MRRKRVIWITGASGFTGRHLVRYLRSLPDPGILVGLGRRRGEADHLDFFHTTDLTIPESLAGLVSVYPPDVVYHLAGLVPPAPEASLWHTNVGGTHHLLQSLSKAERHRPKIVIVSSAAVYLPSGENFTEDHPAGGLSSYGRSKWSQEAVALAMARNRGLDVMIARPFNLIGPGLPVSLVAGNLCAQFREKSRRPVRIGRVSSQRDFVDVRDAVSAYHTIASRGESGRTYNVCTGRATRISTLLQHFQKAASCSRRVIVSPDANRGGAVDRAVGNGDRLRALGWKPSFTLRRSVADMLEGGVV